MSDPSSIYGYFRCTICQHRLNKPLELICKHLTCRECLETILRNHRTNARCRQCQEPLQKYQIEDYVYLSEDHHIVRLLSTFLDVNQCETCHKFTNVTTCVDCSKNQCSNCLNQHRDKYHAPSPPKTPKSNKIIEVFSEKEKQILESIREILTEKEYEDFVYIAQQHLHQAAVNADISSTVQPLSPSSPVTTNTSTDESTKNHNQEKPMSPGFVLPYDWSKHPKFTVDDILSSSPKRVQELLRLNFEPRKYQISMIRAGLRRENSLICLQTGAGKTYIAGMIAKFFYIQSMQSNPIDTRLSIVSTRSRRFKGVFLVPIKALVDQQCSAYRKVFIDQSDTILKPIDTQAGERFRDLYDQFTLFFFTVQKFVNFLENKHTNLSDFDMIIIDECHHCYDNHPTNMMMRLYHRAKASGACVPQIIGLTASVGTNKKKAFDHLVHLCANLDCFDVCAIERQTEQEEVQRTTNTPMADTIITVPRAEQDLIVSKLKVDVMQRIAHRLALDIVAYDTEKLENFLVLTHQRACLTSDRDVTIGTDYLRKLNCFLLQYNDLPLKQCVNKLEEVLQEHPAALPTEFQKFCCDRIGEFLKFVRTLLSGEHPVSAKLKKLVDSILNLHRPNTRGLILVRTKFHTVALEEYLNEHPTLSSRNLKVGHLTGQGSAEEMCLPSAQQADALKKFREGSTQILVATDVAQEGLDIPECSYVIRYEFVSNEIGTVQSRGRARAEQSRCYLITEDLSINYQREVENRSKEEEMKNAIAEKRKRDDQEFRSLIEKEQCEIIYVSCKNTVIGTGQGAVQLRNEPPTSPSSLSTEILCRFCDAYLCSSSDLRLQGSTVVCIGSEFEKRINPSKNNGEKIFCPNTTCHKEIGAVILLSRNVPGYVLQIASLKFRHIDDKTTQIYKKWSLYRGSITPL